MVEMRAWEGLRLEEPEELEDLLPLEDYRGIGLYLNGVEVEVLKSGVRDRGLGSIDPAGLAVLFRELLKDFGFFELVD